jgi:serine/threonine protein kinase
MFATEPVSASLRHAITASSEQRRGGRAKDEDELELDEVEIQKGLSQLAKGLQFLHDSAKLVHGNLTPDSVIINAKGDWKVRETSRTLVGWTLTIALRLAAVRLWTVDIPLCTGWITNQVGVSRVRPLAPVELPARL